MRLVSYFEILLSYVLRAQSLGNDLLDNRSINDAKLNGSGANAISGGRVGHGKVIQGFVISSSNIKVHCCTARYGVALDPMLTIVLLYTSFNCTLTVMV